MSKFLLLFLLLHPSLCMNQSWYSFAVFWNVGQGQWVTVVNPDQCIHFDFGGELSYFNQNKNLFLKLCKNKQNILQLSHPDLDHYALYPLLVRNVAKICWRELDHTLIPLKRITRKVPLCSEVSNLEKVSSRLYTPEHFKNKNDSSKIYSYKTILIPGDSSQKQEKIWGKSIKKADSFKVLLLGHHGSRTSSGDYLLSRLTNLKMAIAQARKEKFDHPHEETVQRLKNHHIPLVKIEDWGTTAIQFE